MSVSLEQTGENLPTSDRIVLLNMGAKGEQALLAVSFKK